MKIKTTLAIAAMAVILTACGNKEEAAKPAAPTTAPAPAVAAPAPAAPTQAETPSQGKPAETAAEGGPQLRDSKRWSR